MRSVILLLIGLAASTGVGAGADSGRDTQPTPAPKLDCSDEPKASPDVRWNEVLRIAQGRGAWARGRLEALKKANPGQPSSRLADTILGLWKEGAATFESPLPSVVVFKKPTHEELKRLFPGKTTSHFVAVTVHVDAAGRATDVELVTKSGDRGLDHLVVCRALNALFCPVKTGDSYAPGKITLTVHTDVW